MKRLIDVIVSTIAIILFFPVILLCSLLIKLTSKGPVLYWSQRVGQDNKIFLMPKFRSMHTNAPQVATHLLQNSQVHITKVGSFLRTTSLDELPQLWSVLVGNMSLVGPRPALFNQHDLTELRTKHNIHVLRPGITGWAQINGRDEIPMDKKIELDLFYHKNASVFFDMKILFLTVAYVFERKGIKH